nr:Ig-like domain-containing protein [Mycobacterium aquaticum]
MTIDRRMCVRVLAAVLLLTAALGVALAVSISRCADCDPTAGQQLSATPPPPAELTIIPGSTAVEVDPLAPVEVSARFASLSEVVMVNEQGTRIVGITTPDATVWKPGVPLGYGRTYTITATAVAPDGSRLQRNSTFSTLQPDNQTRVRLTTTSGAELRDGGTYGIGTVVVARFDEPITDKAAAERRLLVTTAPAVTGSWYWLDDQRAHWRPAQYHAPGTTILVQANIYGAALGDGLYGQEDAQVRFVIGDAHVAIADDATKQVSVFDNGQLVRTMPTSMGMGGTETINGQTISFWTQRGVYTVMDKANPVVMDSSTYGLPINSRLGYREVISWATRISTDGIYLHQLESTVWAQGNTNVSHGCLNLNPDNARWFYEFSQSGDVVEVRNTGGEPLQVWQNGDWSVPWEQWKKGSALS